MHHYMQPWNKLLGHDASFLNEHIDQHPMVTVYAKSVVPNWFINGLVVRKLEVFRKDNGILPAPGFCLLLICP